MNTQLPDLRADLRLRPGEVPATIAGALFECGGFVASGEAFLLKVTDDLRFHYRRGEGVRCFARGEMDVGAVSSFHSGSVYGAAAWMNGYVPLHASAVVFDGGVHAFAGPSGEGKSTLVAALAERGLELFADDVLTLDTSGPSVRALPGHKRLKLWSDALKLVGANGHERVWPGVDKYFVGDGAETDRAPLPLSSLTLLESSADDEVSIVRLSGAARFLAISGACYRPEYRVPSNAATVFAKLAAIAHSVPTYRLSRPRNLDRFAQVVDVIAAHVAPSKR